MVAFEISVGFVVLVLFLLAVFYAFSVFNGLISLKNNIEKAWANIDVVLKQRNDLIPNLVEAVKGYMKYERTVLSDVTRLRTQMMAAQTMSEKASAHDALSGALKSLFAVAEKYPDLKASSNFLDLQQQLSTMENQIADRREFYNDAVMLFNTRIHSLPDLLVASMMGFRDKEYFKATEEEEKPIEVKMGQ
jgi:LemA protein